VSELVPGFEASNWYGLYAPKGTPCRHRRQAQQGNQCRARRAETEGTALRILAECLRLPQPVEFGRLIANETEKMGQKWWKFANIQAE